MMHRAFIVALLIVCLGAVVTTAGCLFGKKGEEGTSSESAAKAPGEGATGAGAPAPGPKGPLGGPAGPMGGPAAKAPAGAAKGALGPAKAGAPAAGPKAGLAAGPKAGGPGVGPEAPPGGLGVPSGGITAAQLKQAKAAKAAGDYTKALQLLAAASPQDAEAQWLKAWMLAEQGKKAEATTAFNAFIAATKATDPRVAEARAALERLGGGVGSPGAKAGKAGPAAGPPGGMGKR